MKSVGDSVFDSDYEDERLELEDEPPHKDKHIPRDRNRG